LMVDIAGSTDAYEKLRGWKRDAFYDADLALDHLYDALGTLSVAGEAWADWKSIIARPNDPNARRLYFIRSVTELFRRAYREPLRQSVAVLTNCLFDCAIDPSTVAKLAP